MTGTADDSWTSFNIAAILKFQYKLESNHHQQKYRAMRFSAVRLNLKEFSFEMRGVTELQTQMMCVMWVMPWGGVANNSAGSAYSWGVNVVGCHRWRQLGVTWPPPCSLLHYDSAPRTRRPRRGSSSTKAKQFQLAFDYHALLSCRYQSGNRCVLSPGCNTPSVTTTAPRRQNIDLTSFGCWPFRLETQVLPLVLSATIYQLFYIERKKSN